MRWFVAYEWPDRPYPGDAEIEDELDRTCLNEFESYVGGNYDTSTLDFRLLLPGEAAWKYSERIGE